MVSFSTLFSRVPVALLVLLLAGCASYAREQGRALDALERGDYAESARIVESVLGDRESDRLLYHLELGVLRHLNGEYADSNEHFHRAEALAEELYTRRASELLAVTTTNPRSGPYRGADFEQALIHYYTQLNYLLLARQQGEHRRAHLEAARVEARKTDILLSALAAEDGDHGQERTATDRLRRLMAILTRLSSNVVEPERIRYREDAFLRYVTGLVYESIDEHDNARVAYENAARLYEEGFAEQYRLGEGMARQARLDTVRMLRLSGNDRWREAAETLDAGQREALERFFVSDGRDGERPRSQIVIIQHLGSAPRRRELNLLLELDPLHKEFVLWPVLHGTPGQRQEQLDWFFLMHADTHPLQLIDNYNRRGIHGVVQSPFSKHIPLGPVWNQVRELGLTESLTGGVRVTLPYYPPYDPPFGDSELRIDGGDARPMLAGASPARCALQAQLAAAGADLRHALAREITKQSATFRLLGERNKELSRFTARLFTAATSAAETRGWLTLPAEVRLRRVPVDPGYHELELETHSAPGGRYGTTSRGVTVGEESIVLIRERSFNHPIDITKARQ